MSSQFPLADDLEITVFKKRTPLLKNPKTSLQCKSFAIQQSVVQDSDGASGNLEESQRICFDLGFLQLSDWCYPGTFSSL